MAVQKSTDPPLLCQVGVKGRTGFGTAIAVRDHLVTVLSNGIERPFVHLFRAKPFPYSVTRMGEHVPQAPCRIVAVCQLECAIPDTGI